MNEYRVQEIQAVLNGFFTNLKANKRQRAFKWLQESFQSRYTPKWLKAFDDISFSKARVVNYHTDNEIMYDVTINVLFRIKKKIFNRDIVIRMIREKGCSPSLKGNLGLNPISLFRAFKG